MGRSDLTKALARLVPAVDPRLLVGPETFDDAAVVALSPDLAICLTADFITPVVDEPESWGRIAAANSISDIYAMGGQPLAALNLVCWPSCLDPEILAQVLAGGARAAAEAACMVVGGHSVTGQEPMYGMAVIGTVRPDRVLRNQGALPGDVLYLSKPLGTGIIATAVKAGLASREEAESAVQSMAALNREAAQAALAVGVRAMTDVTGFGLAGHLTEMLGTSGQLGAQIAAGALPLLPGVSGHLAMGLIPAGAYRNREAYCRRVRISEKSWEDRAMLLYDPQTSGGLLAAVPHGKAELLEEEAARRQLQFRPIGVFTDSGWIELVA